MEDRNKVNSMQLFMLWKNLSLALAVMIGVVAFTRMVPFFLAPAVALVGSGVLYTMLYNNRSAGDGSCMLAVYAVFYCLISYTFVAIIINVLFAWGLIVVPGEFIFFNHPYVPNLILMPVSFLVAVVLYIRRHDLQVCVDCRLANGTSTERGFFGTILRHETTLQLKNLIFVFGILSVALWTYYLFFYVDVNQNGRDWYVFAWIVIFAFLLDEAYYAMRYYNLYLDLKENDEIITPRELSDMTARTYVRIYVVWGNKMYVDEHSLDPTVPFKEVIDTPFETRRSINGISEGEVWGIARKMTGEEGELRFFFGRKMADTGHSLLRYFYFLDSNHECPARLNSDGEWYDFSEIKKLYTNSPAAMSKLFVSDLSRLATIVLTEKTYDERGYRRSRIKSYRPTFNLSEIQDSNLDFQDEKWIRISQFNANSRFFHLKRWWRNFAGAGHKYNKS